MTAPGAVRDPWPPLPLASWRDTLDTLHRWLQIAGKIKLAKTPLVNHFWNVAFPVTARGLTTGAIPHGSGDFQMDFDFVAHELSIVTNEGASRTIPLRPVSVADFEREVMAALSSLGIAVRIWTMPVEIPNPVRFEEDRTHASYDRDAVEKVHCILLSCQRVFEKFRGGFIGKSSPVHFFWGSFDLCVTRFSGRRAPVKPDADAITREAYSHEVSSVGFWPGNDAYPGPAFYSYAAPAPAGFPAAAVRPAGALYDGKLGEFLLPYEAVRSSPDPDGDLLAFCQSTYDAAADLGKWDREALERPFPPVRQTPNARR